MELSYIAGYLDADGTITASLTPQRNSRMQGSCCQPAVQICGQNLGVLLKIMNTLQCGDIRAYRGGYNSTSGAFRFDVPQSHIERVLKALIPHLENKREQAEIILMLMQTRSRGSHKITKEIFELRQQLVARLHSLNKRDSQAYKTNWVNSVKRSSFVTRYESIPSQAVEGIGSTEGVTTSRVSPNNNPGHESPARKGRDSLTTTVM